MTRAIRAQVQTSPRNPYASAPMVSSAGSKANSSAASLAVAPGWGRACNPALPSSRTTFIHCLTARVETSRASAISSWVHPACLSSTARYRRFSFQSTLRVRFLFMLAVYQSCVMREPINAAIYNKEVPWVSPAERILIESLGHDCWRISLYFGFMDRPDVSEALTTLSDEQSLEFDMMQTSFFLSRETLVTVAAVPSGMALWRERMFAAMARNARSAVEYFNIPSNRVIELGTRIEI